MPSAPSIARAAHDPDRAVDVSIEPVVDRDLLVQSDRTQCVDRNVRADRVGIARVIEVTTRFRQDTPKTDADLGKMFTLPRAKVSQPVTIDDRSLLEGQDHVRFGERSRSEDALPLAQGVAHDDVYLNMSLSCGRTYVRAVSLPSGRVSPRTIAAGRRSSFPITSSVAAAISSAIAISVTRSS